jgi:hypothetical protein
MSTTTTIGEARAALVTALDTGVLADHVHYAWPGPISGEANELVYVHDVRDWTMDIPNIKAGRKQRQESYTFELVIFTAHPEQTAAGAQTAFERALTLLGVVEDELADDVQLGDSDIQLLQLAGVDDISLLPHQTGWACELVALVEGQARLT